MGFRCQTCNTYVNGFNFKMVMIREDLWLSIANKSDCLCDKCIEDLLGRKITKSDLKYEQDGSWIPVNLDYFIARE